LAGCNPALHLTHNIIRAFCVDARLYGLAPYTSLSLSASFHEKWVPMCVLAVVTILVIAVIVELHRPRSGFILGSQQPMIGLQQRS
jgi:hypothetical protein